MATSTRAATSSVRVVTPRARCDRVLRSRSRARSRALARSRVVVARAAADDAADEETPAAGAGDEDARVIVITSGKGGVGKTTTSANLGMSIARLGYRVCLVDADIGLRNLDLLLGLENRVMYTAMEVLEGECRMEQALIRDKRWRSLALLPISKNRQKYNVTKDSMNLLIDI